MMDDLIKGIKQTGFIMGLIWLIAEVGTKGGSPTILLVLACLYAGGYIATNKGK